MFDFDRSEEGSQERFEKRKNLFQEQFQYFPKVHHYGWWVLHNSVAHFFMGLFPIKAFFDAHDWTSLKLNGLTDESLMQLFKRKFKILTMMNFKIK